MGLEKLVEKEKIHSAIILPDVHMTEELPKDYLPVRKFIQEFKPDKIILLGDFMDVASLSGWDMDKKRVMEGRRFKKEVAAANHELTYLGKHTKEIVYLEGNHEWRVDRYLDKNPEMEGMIELKEQLRLKERKVKWVPYMEQGKKPYKLGDMHFIHGMYTNKYSAAKHLQTLGCNICYGHGHTTQTYLQNMAMQKPHMAYALGTLGDKAPDYLKGKPANWINQFGVFYWNKEGSFNLYPVNIIKNKFMWNGKEYK